MKRFRGLIIFAVFMGGCIATEYISHRRINPTGVSTLSEYLAWRPGAEQFAVVDVNGAPHVIAYGPMSSWLLLSSGPSAYIFDDAGRLVDWSYDIGDDSDFDKRWNAQPFYDPRRSLPRSDIQKLASTQPVG